MDIFHKKKENIWLWTYFCKKSERRKLDWVFLALLWRERNEKTM